MCTTAYRALAALSLAAVSVLSGCLDDGDADVGTVNINLVGQGTSGVVYRLRYATFTVDGPAAIALLRGHVAHRDREVGLAVMRALASLGSCSNGHAPEAVGADDEPTRVLVEEDLEHATHALRALVAFEGVPAAAELDPPLPEDGRNGDVQGHPALQFVERAAESVSTRLSAAPSSASDASTPARPSSSTSSAPGFGVAAATVPAAIASAYGRPKPSYALGRHITHALARRAARSASLSVPR